LFGLVLFDIDYAMADCKGGNRGSAYGFIQINAVLGLMTINHYLFMRFGCLILLVMMAGGQLTRKLNFWKVLAEFKRSMLFSWCNRAFK